MAQLMKDSGIMIKNTARESILLKLENTMMENGFNLNVKALEYNIIMLKTNMKVIGSTIKNKGKVFNTKGEIDIKANFIAVSNTPHLPH